VLTGAIGPVASPVAKEPPGEMQNEAQSEERQHEGSALARIADPGVKGAVVHTSVHSSLHRPGRACISVVILALVETRPDSPNEAINNP